MWRVFPTVVCNPNSSPLVAWFSTWWKWLRLPLSKNCTKHNVLCDYAEAPPPPEDSTNDRKQANLLMTPKIELELDAWRRSGVFPFQEMQLHYTQHFCNLTSVDMRLVHHVSSIYRDMRLADFVECTFWVQEIPRYLLSRLDPEKRWQITHGSIVGF